MIEHAEYMRDAVKNNVIYRSMGFDKTSKSFFCHLQREHMFGIIYAEMGGEYIQVEVNC